MIQWEFLKSYKLDIKTSNNLQIITKLNIILDKKTYANLNSFFFSHKNFQK